MRWKKTNFTDLFIIYSPEFQFELRLSAIHTRGSLHVFVQKVDSFGCRVFVWDTGSGLIVPQNRSFRFDPSFYICITL